MFTYIYLYNKKKTKRTQKESSPFRNEEKNQISFFLTTKAEYAISTTNKRKNNLGYNSISSYALISS